MGTYTEITEIAAPSSARAGQKVDIEVKVKNLYSAPVYITVTGVVSGTELYFGSIYYAVPALGMQSFYDSFVMPNKSVRLTAASFYWTGSEWYKDDERYVDIALAELVPEFSQFEIKDYTIVG
jgi:hypothetical protein